MISAKTTTFMLSNSQTATRKVFSQTFYFYISFFNIHVQTLTLGKPRAINRNKVGGDVAYPPQLHTNTPVPHVLQRSEVVHFEVF